MKVAFRLKNCAVSAPGEVGCAIAPPTRLLLRLEQCETRPALGRPDLQNRQQSSIWFRLDESSGAGHKSPIREAHLLCTAIKFP